MKLPPQFPLPLSVGTGLLTALTLQLILTSVVYLFGGCPSIRIIVASWILGLSWTFLTSRFRGILWFSLIVIFCIFISCFLFDTAFDSVHYHKGFVRELASGWNPIWGTEDVEGRSWWIYHYCKFAELTGAGIYLLTDVFESACAVSAIFSGAIALILYDLLRFCFPKKLSRKGSALVVAALMFNPVVAGQIFSFLNDSYVFGGVCCMTAAFGVVFRRQNISKEIVKVCKIVIIWLTIILANVKFSHGFYAGLVWLGVGAILIVQKDWKNLRKAVAIGVATFAFAFLIVGYHPYVTNLLRQGNIFYPLLGSEFEFQAENTLEIIRGMSRPAKFVMTQLSYSEPWSVIKDPFLPEHWLTGRSPLMLGFGPLYLPLLILSMILLVINRCNRELLWIAIASVGMSFIFDVSVVARYSPFAWAPIGLAVLSILLTKKRTGSAIALALCAILSGTLSFARNTLLSVCTRERIALFANAARDSRQPVRIDDWAEPELRLMLLEEEVDFEVADRKTFNPEQTYIIYGRGRLECIELNPAAHSNLKDMNELQRAMFDLAGDELRR